MDKRKKSFFIVSTIFVSLIVVIAIITTVFTTKITEFFKNANNEEYLAYNGKKYVSIKSTNTGSAKEVDKIYLRESLYTTPDTSNTGWCLMKNAGIYGIG